MLEESTNPILLQKLEALLFAFAKPLGRERLNEILQLQSESELEDLVQLLNEKYLQTHSSLLVIASANSYQLCVRAEFYELLKGLTLVQEIKLSNPALETLAIIAYKQPVTKAEIEEIRGVNVDRVLQTLFEHDLIREAGRKPVVGRPIIYATSEQFLLKFGLNSLQQLPSMPTELFNKLIVNNEEGQKIELG